MTLSLLGPDILPVEKPELKSVEEPDPLEEVRWQGDERHVEQLDGGQGGVPEHAPGQPAENLQNHENKF